MQRVPLADFEPALKKRLESLWGTPPNLYRALANHPNLIAAWTEFANTLRNGTRTPRALRELLILRGAQLARSEYEWAHHLKMARKAGVRDAQIAALDTWRESPEFDSREKAALAIADAVTEGRVSDETYRDVMKHFDHHDFVELAVTAGFYAMVSRVLDAMRVPLEPEHRDYAPKLP
ncbi:MAG: carboxymuconolactone decarboxylase family protein [Betaproteobacteria bacterium]|nr:MAG: carboxymuconolactone decarboxylase family protein [Betaproteobacteria bacterium]